MRAIDETGVLQDAWQWHFRQSHRVAMDDARADCRADSRPPAPSSRQWWVWVLLLSAGIAAAATAFFGYGQPELLLEAVNLRYCG
jgi:hypothetical protein